MAKQNLIVQIYGYLVCLVAVITVLISVGMLVNSLIDLGDPLTAGRSSWGGREPNLASFESYKMDIIKAQNNQPESGGQSYLPDDQTLRAMYEAAKSDIIKLAKFRALRNIYSGIILIIICLVLFFTHWRWMNRLVRAAE